MQIIGLICEYNPFHYGHLYHIKKIKNKYPNSLLILCLNGYFLQRGDISLLTKEAKTKIALEYNVDLVIELPSLYGCQSADIFAYASIKLLNALNVDKIIFGSESNNINYLMNIAKKQLKINKETLKEQLSKGNSYQKSLLNILEEKSIKSNDLLGIAYCKAILKINKNITLETIKRTNSFNDLNSRKKIISANNIRNKIKNKLDISAYLPKIAYDNLLNYDENIYYNYLKQNILRDHQLNTFLDVKEGIENLLKKEIITCGNIDDFINKIKSKRYTNNYLKRMLLHIFIGLTKEEAKEDITYIHILGFNDKGKNYLNKNRQSFLLPIKVNHKAFIYQFELRCALLYDLMFNTNCYNFELKNKPIYKKTAFDSKESNQK